MRACLLMLGHAWRPAGGIASASHHTPCAVMAMVLVARARADSACTCGRTCASSSLRCCCATVHTARVLPRQLFAQVLPRAGFLGGACRCLVSRHV